MPQEPLVTIAIPSFNQGRYLDDALKSIFQQRIPVEVFIVDGGSQDNTLSLIRDWEDRLAGWRSHVDRGQAAAINEGIARGRAPYVCWLNSDDWLLPGGLEKLLKALAAHPAAPAVYGRCWNIIQKSGRRSPVWVEPFNERRLAVRCIISQPATLIRRAAWEAVGGLDEELSFSMDYDLWWRLYRTHGPMHFVDTFAAVNRVHDATKTMTQRRRHNQESMNIVRKYYGRIPMKWWIAQPYSVWYRSIVNHISRRRGL